MQVDRPEAPSALAAAASLFFQGATACGAVGVTLTRDAEAQGPVTGVEQVLRLAQAEPLLQAVEQWLQSAWDPSPCDDRSSAVWMGYQATVRDPALAPPGTTLHLPLGALLVPPPEPLRSPALAWAGYAAVPLLSRVPAAALDRLEPGALLWLAPAFGPEWTVSLRDPARRLPPCPACLDLRAQRLVVTAGAVDATLTGDDPDADDGAPQVLLTQRVRVPLDHWLGWGRAGIPFHWPVPQPWAAELRHAGGVAAHGALLPLGQGCGLLLEARDLPVAA